MNLSLLLVAATSHLLADPTRYKLSELDLFVSAAYVIAIVGVGIWVGLRHQNSSDEANSYFLAGGTLRWPVIGMALFATNISCVHLVSLAQSGFDTGLLQGNFEWMAVVTLIMLSLFFAPLYIRSGVSTLPDFLERRYCREARDWLTLLSLVAAISIHIGFSMLTGGIVLHTLFDVNMYVSIFVIAALTGLYTIIGGLMAVVITESLQTVILVGGAMLITYFAWDRMGGWSEMVETLHQSQQSLKLSMLRTSEESPAFPWYAIFLGYPVLGTWYWCADQTIVQRVLGAQDPQHARVGALFGGLIKILPVFIFVLPGLFAYTLVASGKIDPASITVRDASGVEQIDSKGVYTMMITQLMPEGLVGVMIAALLAALMSTVAGALNSISTLFSYDLYQRMKPDASATQLVFVGRIAAFVALLLAIGLVPLLEGYPSLFEGLNDIIAHIAPPVTCVFLLGVFWPRASAVSAKWTLWIGSALGLAVFVIGKLDAQSVPTAWLHSQVGESFMMTAFYLFCICLALQVTISFLSPAGTSELASGLYWQSPWEPVQEKGWPGLADYRVLAALLMATLALLYFLFR